MEPCQFVMAEMVQKIPETLHDRPLHDYRQRGELLPVDRASEIGEDRGDVVHAARRLRIAKQVEGGQRCR